MLGEVVYLNCDLPSVQRRLSDPESFFQSLPQDTRLVLDEVHRLTDPSILLKIAADEFGYLKILATGSSTLAATRKFTDSLTGRKTSLHLTPVLWSECLKEFSITDLEHRLHHGGLPERLLSSLPDPAFYAEWLDSFYARDIQELFDIRNRQGFMQLMKLLLLNSGSLTELTQLSKHTGLTRPTVSAYLESLRISGFLFQLSPYHGGGKREIIQRPKFYAFDTGFVTFVKGWNEIREEDRGILWEHLVLDMLRASCFPDDLFYWRDKSGYEIDFVVKRGNEEADLYECKIDSGKLSMKNIDLFRRIYPKGENYCVSPFLREPWSMMMAGHKINFINTINSKDSDMVKMLNEDIQG
jgi:predicted AAA+ superfamily ATPase